jgi:RNA methyltransferase, TrmH family
MSCNELTSLTNPLVKHLVKLRTNREYRYQEGKVLVSGLNLLRDLAPDFSFKTLLLKHGFEPDFSYQTDRVMYVSEEILKKITGLIHPEPLAAELLMPKPSNLKTSRALLVLDGIADPGNLGTLLRTALALGWDGAFVLHGSTDPYNEKALRAAKTATFKLPWREGGLDELRALLTQNNLTLYAADASGQNVVDVKSQKSMALVLGNEAHGITPWLKDQAQVVAVAMSGHMESLNVACAGAIIMHRLVTYST